ncbi:DUF523 domain-containing protein [Treponema vincentii]|jgi:hypothetical protein|uniref:Uncharacterized protein n=1 Tax=Treponema vincentii F0403 TaxID=1125702 RepID=S3MF61_9SPIR|nr:DUF523 domain-containing protein [Treponema vincentii]EPF47664.1 hypothetical protein HMPREF1222_00566 [Treponema vincentii F0403]UTC46424.1 DUF523 domain-containing protein [Treponema vincentii]
MLIVSACLAGFPCRYDGKKAINTAVQQLVKEGKAIPVCPEQLGGLPTPRLPAEMKAGKVINSDGNDVTEAFEKGAAVVLEIAKQYGCTDALLKARSPSCGKGRIYDGSFSGILIEGNGKTADLLMRNGITVTTEEE